MLASADSTSALSAVPQVHIEADVPRVPPHWTVRQLGRLGRLFKGNGGTKADEVDEGIPCIRYGDIYTQYDFLARATRSCVDSERASEYTRIRHGDILFAASGETLEEIGKSVANLIEGDACCGGDLIVFRPSVDADARFFGYATDCQAARSQKSQMGRGMTVMHIYGDQLKRLWIALPPRDEQRAIADFLDRETEKIDALVAKKKRLIELLHEERSALISHAVTRGLDPDVRIKDSRIEWLGHVPEHWDVAPLKRMATRVDVGIAEAATHAYADNGVPIIRSTNVRPGRLNMHGLLFIEEWFAERNRSKYLHEGDIVTVRTGNAGVSAVVPRALERAQCFTLLMTTLQPSHAPEFVCAYLNSAPAGQYFSVEGWGTAQSNISVPILQGIPVPIPPRAEQLQIVESLRQGTNGLDDLAAKIVAAIDKLTEYRSALITAAVTGQIDMREYARKAS